MCFRSNQDQPIPVLLPPETFEGFRVDQTLQGVGRNREGDAGRGERIRIEAGSDFQSDSDLMESDGEVGLSGYKVGRSD